MLEPALRVVEGSNLGRPIFFRDIFLFLGAGGGILTKRGGVILTKRPIKNILVNP